MNSPTKNLDPHEVIYLFRKVLIMVIEIRNETRKYPLHGYILSVLTHTTAWDLPWEGSETLKCDFIIERMYSLRRFSL